MKLSFEQIRSLVTGAAVCRENADGSAFLRRITEQQQAIYAETTPHRDLCETAAGICLDFDTDASWIKLSVAGSCRGSQTGMVVDLLENGTRTGSHVSCFQASQTPDRLTAFGTLHFPFLLKEGEKRVTVCFDHGRSLDGLTVELPDGASLRPHAHKRTFLAFGDSITQGSSARRPSNSYVNRLSRMLDAKVHNYGICGDRFRAEKLIPGTYPACDFVTIAYGTNDFGLPDSTEAGFAHNMPEFLRKAAAEFSHVPIFVLLPLWRQGEEIPRNIGTLQAVRDRIAAEAAKYPNVAVIDCRDFIPGEAKYFADLVLHPNDEGMDRYATRLCEILKELL